METLDRVVCERPELAEVIANKAQIFTIIVKRIMTIESVDRKYRLRMKPRVRSDLWMRPRVSIRAIGPAFCEDSRLRMDGKGISQCVRNHRSLQFKDLLLYVCYVRVPVGGE